MSADRTLLWRQLAGSEWKFGNNWLDLDTNLAPDAGSPPTLEDDVIFDTDSGECNLFSYDGKCRQIVTSGYDNRISLYESSIETGVGSSNFSTGEIRGTSLTPSELRIGSAGSFIHSAPILNPGTFDLSVFISGGAWLIFQGSIATIRADLFVGRSTTGGEEGGAVFFNPIGGRSIGGTLATVSLSDKGQAYIACSVNNLPIASSGLIVLRLGCRWTGAITGTGGLISVLPDVTGVVAVPPPAGGGIMGLPPLAIRLAGDERIPAGMVADQGAGTVFVRNMSLDSTDLFLGREPSAAALLRVTGDLDMTGGRLRFTVDGRTLSSCSRINGAGSLGFNQVALEIFTVGPIIAVRPIPLGGGLGMQAPPVGGVIGAGPRPLPARPLANHHFYPILATLGQLTQNFDGSTERSSFLNPWFFRGDAQAYWLTSAPPLIRVP